MDIVALCFGVFLVVVSVVWWCAAAKKGTYGPAEVLVPTIWLVFGLVLVSVPAMRLSFGEPGRGSELPSNTVFFLEGTATDGNGYTVLLRHLDGDIEAYEHVDLSRLGPFTKPLAVTATREAEKTFLVPFAAPEAPIPPQ